MRILDNTGLVQDPIHLGAVILDKLIGDLKSKLPFLNKKKGSQDDEDEEDEDDQTETETEVADEDISDNKNKVKAKKISSDDDTSVGEDLPEDNSFAGKIKSKLNAFKKKKGGDVVDEASEDVAVAKPKKKPNFIVIIGAALLIGFIILSDFGDEEVPAVDPASMLKKKPKKLKPVAETPAAETPGTETPATETPAGTTPSETVTTTPTETTPVETTPTETVTTTPTETTPVETTPTETVTTTPTETTPVETTPTETVTTTPAETTPVETTPTETTPTGPSPENSSGDSITGEDNKPTGDDLTEQILKDLESNQVKEAEALAKNTDYVAPPNYENVGRGLVYNCIGKHWACIDAPSYRICETNALSNKFHKKKTECYPSNVYQTQSGCEKMQNRMISSSTKTEFCNEN